VGEARPLRRPEFFPIGPGAVHLDATMFQTESVRPKWPLFDASECEASLDTHALDIRFEA
jgi:hypothetical protein